MGLTVLVRGLMSLETHRLITQRRQGTGGIMTEQSTTDPVRGQRKKHRVFLWVFLGIQALFIVWIVGALASSEPTGCSGADAQMCEAASSAGTAIGVSLVIVFWAIVDIILGISYGIYRLAKRP